MPQISQPPAEEEPLRSDARENRSRILRAAREVLLEKGLDAPMISIARRAGVGTATLYRRFPTRSELIAEVFHEEVAACARVVLEAAEDLDPWSGFTRVVEKLLSLDTSNRGLIRAAFADSSRNAEVRALGADAEAAFARLIARAKASGALRADFQRSDLDVVLLANGGFEALPPDKRNAASQRFAALALAAFAAQRHPAARRPQKGQD